MAVCPSCGSEVSGSSKFCTTCGKPMPAATPAAPAPATAFCTSCGSKLQPNMRFCTGCGATVTAATPAVTAAEPAMVATAPVKQQPVAAPTPAARTQTAPDEPPQQTMSPGSSAVQATTPAATQTEIAPPTTQPEPQSIAPTYPAQLAYSQEKQPGSGRFRIVVLILLLVIVLGALGGWYFWGVETVIVCSPPDVRVFLDGQELAASSYGRYVVPHLSRKTHLLKVQSAGFADTIQRLDFPLTSLHEWVNVTLVRSRQPRR